MIAGFLLSLITLYQRTFSPDHSDLNLAGFRRCRFYPSCSEYAALAIRQYGLTRGFMFLLWRFLRCNPWSGGGYDPLPENHKPETLNPEQIQSHNS